MKIPDFRLFTILFCLLACFGVLILTGPPHIFLSIGCFIGGFGLYLGNVRKNQSTISLCTIGLALTTMSLVLTEMYQNFYQNSGITTIQLSIARTLMCPIGLLAIYDCLVKTQKERLVSFIITSCMLVWFCLPIIFINPQIFAISLATIAVQNLLQIFVLWLIYSDMKVKTTV